MKTDTVYIDFETYSEAPINKVGGVLYCEHPSTFLRCLSFRYKGLTYQLTEKHGFSPDTHIGATLHALAQNPEIKFCAHRAIFERHVWKRFMVPLGYPDIPINRWRCTMAKARVAGLPGNLGDVSQWLELDVQKDTGDGMKAMNYLCTPPLVPFSEYYKNQWWFDTLYKYCDVDVETTECLDLRLPDLTETEQRVWEIDQRLNSEGILLDLDLINKAVEIATESKRRIKERFNELTGFNPTQRGKIFRWFVKKTGVCLHDTTKATINQALEVVSMDARTREALRLFIDANKPSLAKYNQMLRRSDESGVSRENIEHHGAHTGRAAGGGINFLNMKRPDIDINTCAEWLLNCETYEDFQFMYADVQGALSSMTRGAVIAPPGKRLFISDFSQMEAVIALWEAGDIEKLEEIANGGDLYCMQAPSIYGHEIDKKKDKDKRFVCKVGVLALNYFGGIYAFAQMGAAYGLDLRPLFKGLWASTTIEEKEAAIKDYMLYLKRCKRFKHIPVQKEVGFVASVIKDRYRKGNPKIVAYWDELRTNAIQAIQNPGEVVESKHGAYYVEDIWLCRRLCTGRVMKYPFPRVEGGKKPNISYRHAKKGRITIHGGVLFENETQANQRDLLALSHIRLEEKYPVSFHVYDENIAAVDENEGDLQEFMDIMRWSPPGFEGLPINVEGWEGYRYGKRG